MISTLYSIRLGITQLRVILNMNQCFRRGVAQKVSISIWHYDFYADFNVTLSEVKGLNSCDRFFAVLRMTFWAKPFRR
jgi:hypothetical protein